MTHTHTPFVKVVRSGARDVNGDLPPEVWREEQTAPTLNAFDNGSEGRATVLAFHMTQDPIVGDDWTPAMGTGAQHGGASIGVQSSSGVRRLTPRECERLMGWPDDHTRWDADGNELPDSARYRMCGNGVAAPVAEWIAHRLMDAMTREDR